MSERKKIKVTYSTLASPDPLLHQYFDEAVAQARANLGQTLPMLINGEWVHAAKTFAKITPIDTSVVIGHFQSASTADVNRAVAAAKAAFPGWRDTPWQERIAILRKAADLISDRLFEIGAVVSLEIGKNRLEALGDVEEAADLIRYCCDSMEENNGFDHTLKAESDKHHNRSVLKPHGVWGVISPFNFPAALSAGPTGAALVTGNTVVQKPAEDGPYTAVLLAQCFVDAGIPTGVFNMVTGAEETGKAITANPDVAGLTFTGSYEVGMSIIRNFAASGPYPRPVVIEMGGKNPTLITEKADLDKAAVGVTRSAFGLQGQKCSACSRVYVHKNVKNEFTSKLLAETAKIKVGDPTQQENWMGPVINETAFHNYQHHVEDLQQHGDILTGGQVLDDKGYYVAPTVVDNLPENHPLWKQEMFLPIVTLATYDDKEAAMQKANDVNFGLTAGFFSEDDDEVQWFLDNIEAGVLYVNRSSGATTGAWPGYQSFGGWKGSTGTNKAAGSFYYLPQYMREQSHTVVD
jgi:1-pyrroline-5-carboxylate dehydrogenase